MEQKWQMHQTSAIALAAVKLFRLQQRLSLLLQLNRECHAGGHTADVSLKETICRGRMELGGKWAGMAQCRYFCLCSGVRIHHVCCSHPGHQDGEQHKPWSETGALRCKTSLTHTQDSTSQHHTQ
jgi:hypothetical protein